MRRWSGRAGGGGRRGAVEVVESRPSAAELPFRLTAIPVRVLLGDRRLASSVVAAGYDTLGKVLAERPERLAWATGLGEGAVARLLARAHEVADGEWDPTRSTAATVEEELRSILEAAGLPDIDREVAVVESLAGLVGGRAETLGATGERLGITRERTRQIRNRQDAAVRRVLRWYEPRALRVARDALSAHHGLVAFDEVVADVARAIPAERYDLGSYLRWLLTLAGDPAIRLVEADLVVGPPVGHRRYQGARQLVAALISERATWLDELVDRVAGDWAELDDETVRRHVRLLACTCGYENVPGLFGVRRWSRAEWAEFVLEQEGSPLHFTEIAGRVNRISGRGYDETGFNSLLNSDPRFVRVGAGDFALAVWGGRPYGRFDEVVERYLRERGRPEHVETIQKDLLGTYTVKPATVTAMLTTWPDRFRHFGGGYWGLASRSYEVDAALERELEEILGEASGPLSLAELHRRVARRARCPGLPSTEEIRRTLYISPRFERYGRLAPERFRTRS